MRLLVIEDDPALQRTLAAALREEGYAVDVASDGADGLFKAQQNTYDAILLDVMLPKLDGWGVLAALRPACRTPVLMLTARDAVPDRIKGLNAGADDYLVKPFAFSELLARIRAVTRREGGLREPVLNTRGLELDPNTNRCRRNGKEIHLTPKEFALVYYLARNEGRAVPQEELLEHIWDEHANPFTQTVKVHMNNLRRKLNDGFDDQLIETIRGKGYVL